MKQFNHPYTKKACISRLLDEYEKHGNLIIGFDFDSTIYDYNKNGGDYSCVIELLQDCSLIGFTMCLYTTEQSADKLQWKIQYCKEHNINVNYVNESPCMTGTAKPYFNILLDDRAGLEEAYYTLADVVDSIKNKK